jgi:endonuclease YncB( thermonuclease family)
VSYLHLIGRCARRYTVAVCLFVGCSVLSLSAQAVPASKVFLNGVPTPVYFNDGDSFRVLSGPMAGSRARLKGYNTLESYGRCHQWGDWTRLELSHYATLGTLNAQRGVWTCTSDMSKDYYGRILWNCKDLAIDQIRKGLAHAMTVTEKGADAELLAAQRYAIKHRKGMWAHGVPEYVMTSLHSKSEGWSAYNRLVASGNGHSKKWKHGQHYDHCQTVCQPAEDFDGEKVKAWIRDGLPTSSVAAALKEYSPEEIVELLAGFVAKGKLASLKDESVRYDVELVFSRLIANGSLTTSGSIRPCMVYVEFKRRYGRSKAKCLK